MTALDEMARTIEALRKLPGRVATRIVMNPIAIALLPRTSSGSMTTPHVLLPAMVGIEVVPDAYMLVWAAEVWYSDGTREVISLRKQGEHEPRGERSE